MKGAMPVDSERAHGIHRPRDNFQRLPKHLQDTLQRQNLDARKPDGELLEVDTIHIGDARTMLRRIAQPSRRPKIFLPIDAAQCGGSEPVALPKS